MTPLSLEKRVDLVMADLTLALRNHNDCQIAYQHLERAKQEIDRALYQVWIEKCGKEHRQHGVI